MPEGWLAFCGIDSNGDVTPKKIHIFKDARLETDIFTHAGITICYFAKGEYYYSPKGFYDEVRDIEPVTMGGRTFSAYTCQSFGYPYTMLECREEGTVFQIMVLMKNGDHMISLEDSDVIAILSDISCKECKETAD